MGRKAGDRWSPREKHYRILCKNAIPGDGRLVLSGVSRLKLKRMWRAKWRKDMARIGVDWREVIEPDWDELMDRNQ